MGKAKLPSPFRVCLSATGAIGAEAQGVMSVAGVCAFARRQYGLAGVVVGEEWA